MNPGGGFPRLVKKGVSPMILGEPYDPYFGLDEYDPYDPFKEEEE